MNPLPKLFKPLFLISFFASAPLFCAQGKDLNSDQKRSEYAEDEKRQGISRLQHYVNIHVYTINNILIEDAVMALEAKIKNVRQEMTNHFNVFVRHIYEEKEKKYKEEIDKLRKSSDPQKPRSKQDIQRINLQPEARDRLGRLLRSYSSLNFSCDVTVGCSHCAGGTIDKDISFWMWGPCKECNGNAKWRCDTKKSQDPKACWICRQIPQRTMENILLLADKYGLLPSGYRPKELVQLLNEQ